METKGGNQNLRIRGKFLGKITDSGVTMRFSACSPNQSWLKKNTGSSSRVNWMSRLIEECKNSSY